MKISCLGSGSRGNAFLVEARGKTVMVDCGFSSKSMRKRLARRNVSAGEIDHILLTHEHADHSRGVAAMAMASGADVWMTAGAAKVLNYRGRWRRLEPGVAAVLGGMTATPFSVCHDAAEPVQFVLDDGARRLGIATDMGRVCPDALSACADLDGLVVECNYDAEMLRDNVRYPARVKARISGGMGHLENGEATNLARAANGGRLRFLAAAHLSENNNRPDLARKALALAVGGDEEDVAVAGQEDGFAWRGI